MPAHDVAKNLIDACGFPLAAPSANLSGSPSPTTARHVVDDLAGRIPMILDGGSSPVGVESTVLTLVGAPTVLRPGFVTPQEIEDVLGKKVAVVPAIQQDEQPEFKPPSPGMKYKHYAPKARITIIQADLDKFIGYISDKICSGGDVTALCYEDDILPDHIPCVTYGTSSDAASQAAALFGALRRLDELGARHVFARHIAHEGIGLAVRNRLLRSAAFREVCL